MTAFEEKTGMADVTEMLGCDDVDDMATMLVDDNGTVAVLCCDAMSEILSCCVSVQC